MLSRGNSDAEERQCEKPCHQWVRDYLGDRPTGEDYHKLIEAISGLIYSDDDVAIEEAKLLTKLESLNPANESPQSGYSSVLKEIPKIYRSWVDRQS